MKTFIIVGLGLFVALASSQAAAQSFDGSKPLLCASVEAYDCGFGGECLKGTADSIDAPRFIRLNFTEKIARATRPDGEVRTAEIESISREEGRLILQGVQRGLGWSMSIAQESGNMALTATGDQVAFVIFGVCTLL